MKVYLVAEQGSRTAFKITTAHAYSNLENVVRQQLHSLIMISSWKRQSPLRETLLYMGDLNVSYVELDDVNVKAKRLKDADWKIAVKDFIKKYPGEISKAEEDREKIGK